MDGWREGGREVAGAMGSRSREPGEVRPRPDETLLRLDMWCPVQDGAIFSPRKKKCLY